MLAQHMKGVISLQEEMCIFSFIDDCTLKYTFELFYHNLFSSLILKSTGGLLSLYHVLFSFFHLTKNCLNMLNYKGANYNCFYLFI